MVTLLFRSLKRQDVFARRWFTQPVEIVRPPLRHFLAFRHGIATGIGAAHGVFVLVCEGMLNGIGGEQIGGVEQG